MNVAEYADTQHQIVIHVCDESKQLKQDFACPRALLMSEMRYFSHNLDINVRTSSNSNHHHNNNNNNNNNSNSSTGGAHAYSSIPASALAKKTLDEIDISVHCDIFIFDWLMRYVKRNVPHLIEKNVATPLDLFNDTANNIMTYDAETRALLSIEPRFELANCISILLSADFLIMSDLVDKCVLFIVCNMELVLQLPCIMNGIGERLLNKLAACVPTTRLDALVDRKDKLRSKLFQRKIEFLFDKAKYRAQFDESPRVLDLWRRDRYEHVQIVQKPSAAAKTAANTTPALAPVAGQQQQQTVDENKTKEEEDKSAAAAVAAATAATVAATPKSDEAPHTTRTNFTEYLYECENDASGLFQCKLCSRVMTKKQSVHLKCQLGIVNARGNCALYTQQAKVCIQQQQQTFIASSDHGRIKRS